MDTYRYRDSLFGSIHRECAQCGGRRPILASLCSLSVATSWSRATCMLSGYRTFTNCCPQVQGRGTVVALTPSWGASVVGSSRAQCRRYIRCRRRRRRHPPTHNSQSPAAAARAASSRAEAHRAHLHLGFATRGARSVEGTQPSALGDVWWAHCGVAAQACVGWLRIAADSAACVSPPHTHSSRWRGDDRRPRCCCARAWRCCWWGCRAWRGVRWRRRPRTR